MGIMRLVTALYERKLSPARVERALARSVQRGWKAPVMKVSPGRVRVACVQRSIKRAGGVGAWVADMERFVRQAAEQGAALAVFPEYNFFDMFGFVPGFAAVNALLRRKAIKRMGRSVPDEGIRPRPAAPERPAGFGAFFMAITRPVERAVCRTMAALAQAYGITVYTGSYVMAEEGRLYNAGSVFSPEGKKELTQKKLHLTDDEQAMGMARGSRLEVIDLGFARAAFPICMDATYFETFRIAREQGADIVAVPISNSEEYSLAASLRGIWGRVQESYVYGLKASQNGWVAGMHFTGIAGVFAPLELTQKGDGLLAGSPAPEGDSLAVAELDITALRRARQEADYLGDINPAFEADYVKRAYARVKGGKP